MSRQMLFARLCCSPAVPPTHRRKQRSDSAFCAVMAARRRLIEFRVHVLPSGGDVVMTTRDTAELRAIGRFVRVQRIDHRAGGTDSITPDLHRMHHP